MLTIPIRWGGSQTLWVATDTQLFKQSGLQKIIFRSKITFPSTLAPPCSFREQCVARPRCNLSKHGFCPGLRVWACHGFCEQYPFSSCGCVYVSHMKIGNLRLLLCWKNVKTQLAISHQTTRLQETKTKPLDF